MHGRPEEFAELAACLASDRAAYITGQAVACDGGALWLGRLPLPWKPIRTSR